VCKYVYYVRLEQQRRDAKYKLAIYNAIYMGVLLFQKCLEDEDVEVRAFAVYILA
jgi:hypothetical protein